MGSMRTASILLVLLVLGCSSSDNLQRTLQQGIQIGSVAVPHVARSTPDRWTLVYQVNVPFASQFRKTPQVFLSISKIEAYTRKTGTFYQLVADNVSSNGFQLNVYGAYMDSFSNCTVTWIAVEQE